MKCRISAEIGGESPENSQITETIQILLHRQLVRYWNPFGLSEKGLATEPFISTIEGFQNRRKGNGRGT
ncbi:unnamed protein product, partial [Nesidiocoris tenuis]